MKEGASGIPLILFLTTLLLLSTMPLPAAIAPQPTIADSGVDSEEVVLNQAQQIAIQNAGGRASTTNWVRDVGPDAGSSNGPGNINSVHIGAMVMDHTNTHIIVGGTLRGDVAFGSIQPATQSGPRVFVASLSKWGSWNWVSMTTVGTGSSGGAMLGDIAVSSTGDIWVVGSFWVDIEWGQDWEVSNGGGIDGFVAKMSSSGGWDWGTPQGGTSDIDSMHGIALDSNGDGYVVGSFEDHTYFGNTSRNIQNGQDGYIVKINKTNGDYVWDTIIGGNLGDNITAIAIDSAGRIFVTGYYQGDVTFGTTTLLNVGALSLFVAEIDSQGNWLWANEAKAVWGGIIPYDIEVNADSIYLGGDIVGLIELDGQNWWVNATVQSAFVARLNKTGTWLWGLNSTGHTQHLQDIALNPLGGVVAVGWFDMEHSAIANAGFGPITLTAAPFAAFFAGVSPTGHWMWAESGGGPLFDSGDAALFTSVGNLIMSGRFCMNHDGAGCSAQIGPANYTSGAFYHGSGFVWSLNTDSDMDDVSDVNDNCPLNFNPLQEDFDSDLLGDVCDSDMDGDGREDSNDNCIGPAINWDSFDWSIDTDGDGCRDSDEDDDDDGDGVSDSEDLCSNPSSYKNWTANDANDYDQDGCHDIMEDDDDDGDGVLDNDDDCAFAPSMRNWTSTSQTDYDGDGCKDSTEEDVDSDNDGVADTNETCPNGLLGWTSNTTTDHDGDGCNDAQEDADDDGDGINDFDDDCTPMATNWDSSGVQDLDKDGCRDVDEDDDDDGDGLDDDVDSCPRGSVGWISGSVTDKDGDGCRDTTEDLDDDNDLILDDDDGCARGETGWVSTPQLDADRDGCRDSDEDPDDDGDGFWEFDSVGNIIDQCPNTPLSESHLVDGVGCSPSQADDDNDGVVNSNDECPDVAPPEGLDRDENGCTDDIDQDGVNDDVDAFPNDTTQTEDRDGDGYGDNLSGVNPDSCRDTPSQWIENVSINGCAEEEEDFDDDGILNGYEGANCSDTPPGEVGEIDSEGCSPSQIDSDGDGTPDSVDQCPDTKAGVEAGEGGCSTAQLAYTSDNGGSSLNLMAIAIAAGLLMIIVGGGAAFFLLNRDDDDSEVDDLRPQAAEVFESLAQERLTATDTTGTASPEGSDGQSGITVDDDGIEWWQDEAGVWWYRSLSMDDWAVFEQ